MNFFKGNLTLKRKLTWIQVIVSILLISSSNLYANDEQNELIDLYDLAISNIRQNPEKAVQEFKDVAEQAKNKNIPEMEAKSLSTLAKFKAMLGHEDALSIGMKGLAIAADNNLPGQQVAAYESLGAVTFYLGDSEQALEYYTTAQSIYEDNELDDKKLYSMVNNNIVNIYDALGQYDLAIDTLLKLLEFKKKHGLSFITNVYNLAHFYNRIQDTENALVFAKLLKLEAEKENHFPSKLDYHFLSGEAFYNKWLKSGSMAELNIAERHHRQALDYSSEANLVKNFHYCDKLIALARVSLALGKSEESRKLLVESLALAESLKQEKQIIETHELLVSLYKLNDYEKAFGHLEEVSKLRQKQYQKNLDKRISAMLIKFDTVKKEHEISQAALENESLQKSITIARYVNNMMIGLAIVTLLLLLMMYSLYVQKKKSAAKFEKLSNYDPLTKLMNRRAIKLVLEQQEALFKRQNVPFNIVIADIDFFKKINDQYGHDCGDEVLVKVSKLLREQLRVEDSIARWGGEEFLIILPNIHVEDASIVVEKLRKSIESEKIEWNSQSVTVTMSFGMTSFDHDRDAELCITQADEALYKAKEAGRNNVYLFRSNEPNALVEVS